MKLKHLFGPHACLDRRDPRFKLIQLFGFLLYGRKLSYASWWLHAARSSGVMLFHEGKLLLGRRDNSFDGNKKFSTFGGFVDDFETFAQATSRELREEVNLIIPPAAFTANNLFCIDQRRSSISEQRDMPSVSTIYIYHPTEPELSTLKTSREVSELRWVDETEFDEMYNNGEIAFEHTYKLGKQAFAEGWADKVPSPHTIHEREGRYD